MDLVHGYLDAITNLGSLPFVMVILVVALLAPAMTLFWTVLYAYLIVFLIIAAIKFLFFKRRPENARKKATPTNLLDRVDQSTFPSFHAANAAVLAIMLSVFFADVLLSLFFAFLALCVIVSRVHLKKHYVVDVTVGAVLGIVASGIVLWCIPLGP